MHVCAGVRSCASLGLPPAPSQRHEYSSMDVTLEIVDNEQEVCACAYVYVYVCVCVLFVSRDCFSAVKPA